MHNVSAVQCLCFAPHKHTHIHKHRVIILKPFLIFWPVLEPGLNAPHKHIHKHRVIILKPFLSLWPVLEPGLKIHPTGDMMPNLVKSGTGLGPITLQCNQLNYRLLCLKIVIDYN